MFEEFEKYELKDGRVGWAADVLGDGEACIFEFDKEDLEDRIDTVFWDDVKRKIPKNERNK
ncbi:MAG TPA: hypothetical protein IAA06_13120 [Candidatus Blautia faecavium]|uniref:Uncharacterized protein n=1 Tax=Candidatus Blautia faecavium TaxID=2838487 RepID=A0A9D2RXN2_9FIRM|nr:hypothetical protein [Candidatus Blautia faecavium]